MRTIKFLNKVKEKKKRKEKIKKELDKVEKGNKRKISNFFDSKVFSMIKKRSSSIRNGLGSVTNETSDPRKLSLSPEAK